MVGEESDLPFEEQTRFFWREGMMLTVCSIWLLGATKSDGIQDIRPVRSEGTEAPLSGFYYRGGFETKTTMR